MAGGMIVHGGAGNWEGRDHALVLAGIREAMLAGWRVIQAGGTAMDAVEQATIILEDDPLFDAGYGSFLNEHGEVEMDALIVDGEAYKFGAVAAVQHVKNPIRLARLVLNDPKYCFFVGTGADEMAVKLGLETIANIELVTESELQAFAQRQQRPQDDHGLGTVGAVARDHAGNIASATSTGGVPNKKKGRVGDTPIFGAGGFAQNGIGGASATGVGENIMRYFLSKQVVDYVSEGQSIQTAAEHAVQRIVDHIPAPEVGVIALDAEGRPGAAHSTRFMPIGWIDTNGDIQVRMKQG